MIKEEIHLSCEYISHNLNSNYLNGKISAQPHTILCIQFLDRENNDKNNRLPLGKQICFTIVWGCAEILPLLQPQGHTFVLVIKYTKFTSLPLLFSLCVFSGSKFGPSPHPRFLPLPLKFV